jgi:signal transduction histidine kinase/CheY-like chemotaxis protein
MPDKQQPKAPVLKQVHPSGAVDMPVKKNMSVFTYLCAVCFLGCVIVVFDIIVYSITAGMVKQQLTGKCFGIASAVAAVLEENPAGYREFCETLDTGSDYYIRTKGLIEKVRFDNLDSIAFLYVEVRFSEDEMMYVLDGEKEGTAGFSPPGEKNPLTITRRRAYDTRGPSMGDFVTTAYGTLMSAYAPVFDTRNGELIGLVGADVSIEQYEAIMRKIFVIIAAGVAIITIMGALIIRLGIARIRADRENISKSKFLSTMSHEIRTPLNAILGLSEVELQRELPYGTRHNLEKIYDSGSLLLEIVNGILDISKIESGSFEIFSTDYEIAGLINDTIQLNIMRIGSKPIEFKLRVDKTLPMKLHGDEVRIRQILNNLLSNAFKYTEAGEVRFSVTWEREGEDARLCFTVEDTGRGIRQEDMAKLFSEYTQFETATNRKIEGTGLGLFITKGLVEKMGGRISAESVYGKGSVFRIQLPQGIVNRKPLGKKQAEALENFRFIEGRNRGRGNTLIRSYMPYGKVLVVDDLQTNLDVMKGLLMPYGLAVDTALSGKEAVKRIRYGKVRYDLVFMDHMMPEMDGIEAARIIRREIDNEYARTVPLIALTANAVRGSREMFLTSGFNDYISKPVDIKRLDIVLNRWVRDKQSEETLREAENQNLARAETGVNPGLLDEEGAWLLRHPVEGIGFVTTLALYGNSGAAYMPILKSFVSYTPPLLEKMDIHQKALSPDYAIEAHGLKGTCNAIGATQMAELARELEAAARGGDFDLVRRKHGPMRREALELTTRLQALLDEWEANQPEAVKDRRAEPDRELLARLSDAAGEYSANAVEGILGELEQYKYERGQELITTLREQADRFDYDAMRKGLEEFRGTT